MITTEAFASSANVQIPPTLGQVAEASSWLLAQCEARRVPPKQTQRLDICLNEILANVISHAGLSVPSQSIEIQLGVTAGLGDADQWWCASLMVSDCGVPFDPTHSVEESAASTLASASIGGRGLKMIRGFSDEQFYRREGGKNIFTVTTRWPAPVNEPA